ncbi:MAG: hypothetical protein MUC49_02160 [Raineya sp.]|jgi:hypothetical protein|nr:hypothetical protein [Raineya sp.]
MKYLVKYQVKVKFTIGGLHFKSKDKKSQIFDCDKKDLENLLPSIQYNGRHECKKFFKLKMSDGNITEEAQNVEFDVEILSVSPIIPNLIPNE